MPDRSLLGTPAPIAPLRRMKRGIGSTAEGVKREMFRRVRELSEDVGRFAPECDCGRFFCPWDGLRKGLDSVARSKGDLRRLQGLAKGGKPIPRAFAASLALAKSEKVEGMAPFRLGSKTYYFAPSGAVPAKALLGVQNPHVPGLRLLALSLVRGRSKYVVYAWEGGTAARRPDEPPPEAFVESLGHGTKYSLRRDKEGWTCAHAATTPHVSVGLPGGSTVRICTRCARDDENLSVHGGNRILAPVGRPALTFRFHPSLRCSAEACSIPDSWEVNPMKQEGYARGEHSDRWIATKEVARLGDKIVARQVFTAAGVCYENDAKAFVRALAGTSSERKALLAIAPDLGGVQLPEATAGRLLEIAWPKHAKAALVAVAGDEAVALLEGMPNATPQQLVAAAENLRRADAALTELPKFRILPPLAEFLDRAARSHRVEGVDAAVRLLESGGKDHRSKAVRYAFLLAVERAKAVEWQFSREEKELGSFLHERTRQLLAAKGEAYREALQGILTLSGSGESLPA